MGSATGCFGYTKEIITKRHKVHDEDHSKRDLQVVESTRYEYSSLTRSTREFLYTTKIFQKRVSGAESEEEADLFSWAKLIHTKATGFIGDINS